ncbi:dTMP kinase [Massiliimalia massiliensis]|uniref:dTMP kinase n=1 Tax=Massiliimalia massiliensis TaxID=1852384 RepID=UPI0009872F91|nr:deoxynucleoside kinase [Massiliimalia massiliensis]
MRGKLIVLDGLDGSGKSTQAQLLADRLLAEKRKVELLSYPDYSQPSSTLVKMYLNGAFSKSADGVNAYAASSFYAVDRYASYMQFWKEKLENGFIMIASRYVSSNAIHQMVKLPKDEWDTFLDWLEDYEYQKLSLPRPDRVIFLDMSRAVADQLILSRYHGDESKKDIHEQNMSYLEQCMESAHYAAAKKGWQVIRCCDGEHPFPIEEIAQKIMLSVKEVI